MRSSAAGSVRLKDSDDGFSGSSLDTERWTISGGGTWSLVDSELRGRGDASFSCAGSVTISRAVGTTYTIEVAAKEETERTPCEPERSAPHALPLGDTYASSGPGCRRSEWHQLMPL